MIMAAAVAAAAVTPLVLDSPYPEIVSERSPYNGLWGGSHPTPTGWTVLPCQTASLVFAARVGDSDDALILCPDQGALYDLTRSVFLPIAGASWPATGVGWGWIGGSPREIAPSCPAGALFLVEPVNGTIFQIACEASSSACTARPVGAVPTSASPLRAMSVFMTETNETMASLWVSGDHGTFVFSVSCSPTRQPSTLSPSLALTGVGANASSYSAALGLVALGNDTALSILDAFTGALVTWDWVTDVDEGWGAPVDGPISALAFGPDGTLYIGNAVCLNLRFANGTYSRIDGAAGLPAANITSIAIDTRTLAETPPRDPTLPRVWIGTLSGAILFDPAVQPADDVNAAGPALYFSAVRRQQALEAAGRPIQGSEPLVLPHAQRWRVFRGPRYLTVTPEDTLSTPVPTGGVACVGNSAYVRTATAGVAILEAEQWTLAKKAAWMEALQVGEDRRAPRPAPHHHHATQCSLRTTASSLASVARVALVHGGCRRTSRATPMIQIRSGHPLCSRVTFLRRR